MMPRWLDSGRRQGRDGPVYSTPEDARIGYIIATIALAIVAITAAILGVVQ